MTDNGHEGFSVFATATAWVQDSIAYRGLGQTLVQSVLRLWYFLRDLTPSRRRLRFGDLDFDFEHNVNTTWSNVGLRTRVREIFSGEPYQPIEPGQFYEMMAALPIEFADFTFIDMGSGKGRALLLASEYAFRRIVGVEIIPELHESALENFKRYRGEKQICTKLESWCGDARTFEFPPENTLLYLFNPFFEPVLKQVLQNLKQSLDRHPRRVFVLYVNPLSEGVFATVPFLRRIGGTHQFSLYES